MDDTNSQNDAEEIKVIPENPVILVGGKAKDQSFIKIINKNI